MSIPASKWHADQELIDSYVLGRLDAVTSASLETHVIGCHSCRVSLASRANLPRLNAVWDNVAERLDDPRSGPVERGLVRLGMTESDARLAASAPALRQPWLLALVAVLAFCLGAAESARVGPNGFLVVAPMLPALAVALAYGPWADPTYEVGLAAPYSGTRLLFLRTAVVLSVTMSVVALTGLVLPGERTSVLWLLPSAALVTVALALCAWMPAIWAAAVTGVSWLIAVAVYWRAEGSIDSLFGSSGQAGSLALLTLGCLAIAAGRRTHAYDAQRFL